VRTVLAVGVLVVVFLTGGCSSDQVPDVTAAAQGFYAAVGQSEAGAACKLLSPAARTDLEQSSGKACPDAVLEEELPRTDEVESAQVYGTMAIVTTGEDTMFLGRFRGGWLVTAVGCRPSGNADRFDCSVTGS
jgi:hypothetical protein